MVGVNGYYKEWKQKPLLSREQEQELISKFGNRYERVRKMAKEELVASNIKIVCEMASLIPCPEGCKYEDNVQNGLTGLMKAVQQYDPSRGTKLLTYALWDVKHQIHHPQSRLIKIPEGFRGLEVAAHQERVKYYSEYNVNPDLDTLAELISKRKGLDLEKTKKRLEMLNLWNVRPMDFSEEPERNYSPVNEQEVRYYKTHEWKEVQRVMKFLSEREREVLKMRYSTPEMTFVEIGKKLGITKGGAEMAKKRAIRKLKGLLRVDKRVDEFDYTEFSLD